VQTQQGYQIIIARVMEASRSPHVLGGRLLPPSIRTVAPLASIPAQPRHELHKPIQGCFEIANSLLGLTVPDRLLDTVLDMLLQDGFADLVERCAHRRDLREHIVAVPALFPQPFEAVGVTGDAREPFGDLLAGWIVGHMGHRRHDFLASDLPSPLGGYLAFTSTVPSPRAKSQEQWLRMNAREKSVMQT